MVPKIKGLARLAVGIAALSTASGEALALQVPTRYHDEQKIDDKQFGYTDVVVNRSGVAKVSTLFSNGKRVDGDSFIARIIFRDASGRPVAAVEQKKGLDASFGGKAREGRVTNKFRLSSDQWARVRKIDVHMGHYDRVNDREIWDQLRALAEKAIASGLL